MLQWHDKAVEPKGDTRSDLWFYFHLGNIIRRKLEGSTDPRDEPILNLTWDYPTEGRHDDPSAEAVLAEINGYKLETTDDAGSRSGTAEPDSDSSRFAGKTPISSYLELKDDG